MLAHFFVFRPVFAAVLAICIMAAGILALLTLPVEQYPDIAPPGVTVTANYPGAAAKTVEDSITQVIEQQIKGIDGLLYFSSTSSSAGQARISLSFDQQTDPDIAQVQVQNAVNQANSRLPQEVQQQGITVTKSQGDSLMVVALYDTSGQMDNVDINDYLVSSLQDPLSRVDGVGETTVFGAQYAMRIWLDPLRLTSYGLMPSDVQAAVEAQNAQVTSGELGSLPTEPGQAMNATVTAQSRLQTPEQFSNIILRTNTDGSAVYLRDVARVEIGAENYQNQTRLNGYPAAGISIQLASGANALAVAESVRAEVERMTPQFPAGLKVAYPRDSTPFVTVSIEGVVQTLIEAIILVVVVMYLFLQNWRATLIPAITVPVVLLGTFGILALLGYSINTLTLFAMVLAIGLLVDDAIVVVENVERVMDEEDLPPQEATLRSMSEINSALIGIALVLSAVFIPMAFLGGSTGIIYRQFSITIVSSMVLSVLVALTLTPALCAGLLRPSSHGQRGWFFSRFNRVVDSSQQAYGRGLTHILARKGLYSLVALLITGLMVWQYLRMPTGFLPVEDQGSVMVQFTLPSGTPMAKTQQAADAIADYFMTEEKDNLSVIFMVVGRNNAGSAQNVGMAFAELKNWDVRDGSENTAQAIIARANQHFKSARDMQVNVLSPPAVRGLGQSSGFELWLQDQSNAGHDELQQAQQQVIATATDNPLLTAVRVNGLEDKAQLQVDIDQQKASAQGLQQADINNTLSAAWGGAYINDFIDRGRVKRVYMQGDSASRSAPDDINQWFVRGSSGSMASFASFANTRWLSGPQMLQRFNGLSATQLQGSSVSGESSGTAMAQMQAIIAEVAGFGLEWSGLSYQEQVAAGQTLWIYLASVLFIFLCLAALYESWSIPIAVMLIIPLGIVGAVLATRLAGFENDIYFQVGMLTTIGLSAKNAILIIEFAEAQMKSGQALLAATLEGARLRLRPIVMTSLAFVAGVIPLALSVGAGASSRREIGIAVIGGMISGTLLALLFVPLFFVLVKQGLARLKSKK
ncbi:efflux RND transporter permease subunit [Serratia quinivorans]|uniref:efflux RND transporter permease subunit n=1 Tax=Serratia quinivorans TaxID=137545 RepID=UPI00217890D9|nr:efflux RND transporter permease subunit [Serratia quinivorans]CAI0803612.1 Multidrug-efflux transporter MexB [Serratia quinivorans]CAI0828975.1 Multidrug-efflux transporter MexB [Serratia quinivorans]CAI1737992.1 Multidrug-efflux transporter MexB [Serratia quinivorans]CAI2068740.1 Multidrug-efflux transporter MexB [Serratia quinivorans]CAI2116413.1 Multidrug-efflux transporter MexB [Serratia quinivorans]